MQTRVAGRILADAWTHSACAEDIRDHDEITPVMPTGDGGGIVPNLNCNRRFTEGQQ